MATRRCRFTTEFERETVQMVLSGPHGLFEVARELELRPTWSDAERDAVERRWRRAVRRSLRRTLGRTDRLAQRLPHAALGYAGGYHRAGDS